jgi:hypothetical protein
LRALVAIDCLKVVVGPPDDGRLTPETCRGLRHNKVIVKGNVY